MSFRALVLTQAADRKVSGSIETLDEAKLPAGDVTVAVEHSTLNYKDALVLTGGGRGSEGGRSPQEGSRPVRRGAWREPRAQSWGGAATREGPPPAGRKRAITSRRSARRGSSSARR